jgi:glycosyltransferase involved in cell wall biosynthesis
MNTAVVVPCYNEAERLDTNAFAELCGQVDQIVFVDDGSSDATAQVLTRLVAEMPNCCVLLRQATNSGKGEAVRAGLLAAIANGADLVAYYDADMATPPDELFRLLRTAQENPQHLAVLGSRVSLLGHDIDRHVVRHLLGRLYATAASLALNVAVYDTQCGTKVFQVTNTLRQALEQPFPDRWSFDVELLARLFHPRHPVEALKIDEIVEVPLRSWRDIGGSKVKLSSAVRATAALIGVRRRIKQR